MRDKRAGVQPSSVSFFSCSSHGRKLLHDIEASLWTSARHLTTAACLLSTSSPHFQIKTSGFLISQLVRHRDAHGSVAWRRKKHNSCSNGRRLHWSSRNTHAKTSVFWFVSISSSVGWSCSPVRGPDSDFKIELRQSLFF